MITMEGALRSATILLAALSASVRMDTDWAQMDTLAMVIIYSLLSSMLIVSVHKHIICAYIITVIYSRWL